MALTSKTVYIVKCEYKGVGMLHSSVEIEGVFKSKDEANRFIDECMESEKDLPEYKKARYWAASTRFYEYE